MPKGVYPRTRPAWNKGIPLSEEQRKKVSLAMKKIYKNKKVWNFQTNPSYIAVHIWIKNHFGKAKKCELCGLKTKPKNKKRYFEWSNKSRTYQRSREDWWQLCKKCHSQFDKDNQQDLFIWKDEHYVRKT